jgi:hypothetical protein
VWWHALLFVCRNTAKDLKLIIIKIPSVPS